MRTPRTQLNELAEAKALHLALGEHAVGVPVSGTKGLYGHALGASGAIEAAITVMALRHGLLPGTCNLVNLDERCELHVLREPLAATPAAALSIVWLRRERGAGGPRGLVLVSFRLPWPICRPPRTPSSSAPGRPG